MTHLRCEKKKDVICGKLTMEREELKNKAEEEQYLKEDRDKMALEMYENWLVSRIIRDGGNEQHQSYFVFSHSHESVM